MPASDDQMNLSCPDEERLAAWLDGTLEDAPRADVTEHLGECDACRQTVALGELMKGEPVHVLRPTQVRRLGEAVTPRSARPMWIWPAAAAVLVATFAALFALPSPTPEASTTDPTNTAPPGLASSPSPRSDEDSAEILLVADWTRNLMTAGAAVAVGEAGREGAVTFVSARPSDLPSGWAQPVEPHAWVALRMNPVKAGRGLSLHLRYRTTARRMLLFAEGFEREMAPADVSGQWVEQRWTLDAALREGAELADAGGELRQIFVGVPISARLDLEVARLARAR